MSGSYAVFGPLQSEKSFASVDRDQRRSVGNLNAKSARTNEIDNPTDTPKRQSYLLDNDFSEPETLNARLIDSETPLTNAYESPEEAAAMRGEDLSQVASASDPIYDSNYEPVAYDSDSQSDFRYGADLRGEDLSQVASASALYAAPESRGADNQENEEFKRLGEDLSRANSVSASYTIPENRYANNQVNDGFKQRYQDFRQERGYNKFASLSPDALEKSILHTEIDPTEQTHIAPAMQALPERVGHGLREWKHDAKDHIRQRYLERKEAKLERDATESLHDRHMRWRKNARHGVRSFAGIAAATLLTGGLALPASEGKSEQDIRNSIERLREVRKEGNLKSSMAQEGYSKEEIKAVVGPKDEKLNKPVTEKVLEENKPKNLDDNHYLGDPETSPQVTIAPEFGILIWPHFGPVLAMNSGPTWGRF